MCELDIVEHNKLRRELQVSHCSFIWEQGMCWWPFVRHEGLHKFILLKNQLKRLLLEPKNDRDGMKQEATSQQRWIEVAWDVIVTCITCSLCYVQCEQNVPVLSLTTLATLVVFRHPSWSLCALATSRLCFILQILHVPLFLGDFSWALQHTFTANKQTWHRFANVNPVENMSRRG